MKKMDNNKRRNPYVSVPPEEEIVISGIAGRFPNSDNMNHFQKNLFDKEDLGSNDNRRWNTSHYAMPSRTGKINNIEKFDAQHFDIPYTQAHMMDPAFRILLELTYEAIIDAGVNPKELRNTRTGVFMGSCVSETANTLLYYNTRVAGYAILGTSRFMMANYISYWLGITGPSCVIDTACSSSLFTLEQAYKRMRNGECDAAIVGGSNLCMHPNVSLQFFLLGVLSPDGYCKPFDEEANGYMRSESITVVYLQKAKDARRIYATCVYAKTNCDGFKPEGITYPSFDMQKVLLKEFYEECGISPRELSYMEAHGTGTQVGDPVEVKAIDQVISGERNTPLLMGSVKSIIGHSEHGSGLCQVAKVLIAMETGMITPNQNFKKPGKEMVPIIEGRIKIVNELTPWDGGYVGINSFGFGGANCHVLLKSNPKNKIDNEKLDDDLPRLVAVSGRTEEAVKTLLNDLNSRPIDVEYIALLHRIHAENIEKHSYRGYTIMGSKLKHNSINKVDCCTNVRKPICFLFPGIEVSWRDISPYANSLMKLPMFAKAIEKCNVVLKPHNICVTDLFIDKTNIVSSDIVKSFVAIVGAQIAMVDLLTHIGIVPDYVTGQSIGELICEYANGHFTAEETILMAYYMGITFEESKLNQANRNSANYSQHLNSIKLKLLECMNRVLPFQFTKHHNIKWLNKFSSQSKGDNSSAQLSTIEYHTNSVLHQMPLEEIISLIPKNTVLIEIVSNTALQLIVKTFLDSTITYISFCKHGQEQNIYGFLEGIGDLYNIGHQPLIANLYPPIQFPVSRGTPMISSLIKWDHTDNWHVITPTVQDKLFTNVRTISISTEEFEYLSGHVIDGRNLLPATGYLYFVWEMIGMLTDTKYASIVFEDVVFQRATYLSKQTKVTLTFMIQKGSNKFEIIEGNNAVVTGKAWIPDDIASHKLSTHLLPKHKDVEQYMKMKDIYKELRLRGYQYTGAFRALNSASITAKTGSIAWTYKWIPFMDNMLQMMILCQDSRNLFVPTRIRKLVIDSEFHIKQFKDYSIRDNQISVHIYDAINAIVSGGVEIHGVLATAISRRQTTVKLVHEEHTFIAHCDRAIMPLEEVVQMSMHIALECCQSINIKVIELIEDSDKIEQNDLVSPVIHEVLENLPLIRPNIMLLATANRFESTSLPPNVSIKQSNHLIKDGKVLMVVAFGVLTKNKNSSINYLLSTVVTDFLLTREDLNGTYDYTFLEQHGFYIILEKRTKKELFVLLRKTRKRIKKREIIHINNYEFSWIDKLKSVIKVNDELSETTRIIVVAEGDFECGILGFINCLRREQAGEIIRCVFIQDKNAPKFSLQEPLYMDQLRLDLPINVLRSDNIWGSYRHFSLPPLEQRSVHHGYVTQTRRGDLSTLRWIEGRIRPDYKYNNLIRIVYSSINFKDIMIATGKLSPEFFPNFGRDTDSFLGFEVVGLNRDGQRIMGLIINRGITNLFKCEPHFSWIIPDKWTFEDAATIPSAYCTSSFALYMRGKMKKGDKVLIHSGTGAVGQSAIYLALRKGCEIFTTVGTLEKRQFIRETFPSIPEDHIGNSRDISFEQMIIQQTKNQGVDIVLNSLTEDKLQASVRCLAKGGRFLEIGKYDLISNNSLGMMAFMKNISFHGIMLDSVIFDKKEERKIFLSNLITEGIHNGSIQPLRRTVFKKDEVETAFRYMAAGKHIGKIIIKIHDEEESLDAPILAYPQYFCVEDKSYIILGGLGGFGLELADWLILRGARKLLLTSRTGIRNGYQRSRIELWKSYGVNVQIVAGIDVSSDEGCAFILNSAEKLGPVDAIFNLAVVLKDYIFENQTPETFDESLKPKALATKKIDKLSRKMCPHLRHFVVFSSVSCGRGNAGQTNYGMANSVMERICEKRVQEGLPGMVIQWGAVGDVGLVADMQEDDKELIIGGTFQQKIESCLNSLENFLMQNRPIVGSMVVAEKNLSSSGTMNILETVIKIMGLKDLKGVGLHTPLPELGIDSMMAVEIKQVIEKEFDIFLTAQDIRNLTFAKLKEIAQDKEKVVQKKADIIKLEDVKLLIRLISDDDIVSEVCLELPTRGEAEKSKVFLLPGIENCGNVFKPIISRIKASATCLQHGENNIPKSVDSVVLSVDELLPHILTKMKDSAEFVLVGYSFGSLIAIELARKLEARNFKGRLILIDGAPYQMKVLTEIFFPFTIKSEFEINVLMHLMDLFSLTNKEIIKDLIQCTTWEEKMDMFTANIPPEIIKHISIPNSKVFCTTIYKHLIAMHEYDISSLPLLKSSITLLKPTIPIFPFKEDDYGLSKITEGTVHIHYVEGNHITILENDEVVAAINGESIVHNE